MTRKPITKEMKDIVVKEAKELLIEINVKLFGKVNNLPEVFAKLGGYTGAYYRNEHKIGIHYYVWKRLSLASKRLLMIHENLHALGKHHSGVKNYSNVLDLVSMRMYLKIYGEDQEWKKMINDIDLEIDKIIKKGE